jgi:hypothetical protein
VKHEALFRRFLDTCPPKELVSTLEAGIREKLKDPLRYDEKTVTYLYEIHQVLNRLAQGNST